MQSEGNLLKENHDKNAIFITGNTAIDALQHTVRENYENEILNSIPEDHKIILMTMHRRENQGKLWNKLFRAIRQVVDEYPDIEMIYPGPFESGGSRTGQS